MEYQEYILSGGTKVYLRARTYAEWEEINNDRFDALDEIARLESAGKAHESHAYGMRNYLLLRNKRLVVQAKDFDNLKQVLTEREVVEIEKLLKEIEADDDITEGNLSAGGAGLLTATEQNTARDA